MKQHYYIDLVEEYSNVNFYSIHLEGEELTEFERFFEKFPVGNEYDEDIDVSFLGSTVLPSEVRLNAISVPKVAMATAWA